MLKKNLFTIGIMLATQFMAAKADVDPNFHIYLCFGQSNMEGNAQWEQVDNEVDTRFQMLATTNFDSPKRTMGTWYTANCPIVSPMGKLGPTDYFGRTMVAAMPTNVKIGVVAVAMGVPVGTKIQLFDLRGMPVYSSISDGTTVTIPLNSRTIHVLKVGSEVIKL